RISEPATTALKAVARAHQVTLNTIIQAVWALLLNHYSGEDDVVFGITVSGRPAEMTGIESMMGVFINTLPFRVQVPAESNLADWLKNIQNRQVELRRYEHSSLGQVQRWSDVPRGQSLFDTILNFENHTPQQSFGEIGRLIDISGLQSDIKKNFPLFLKVTPGTEISIKLSYDAARFDDAAIMRLMGHLNVLIDGIASNPGRCLIDIP